MTARSKKPKQEELPGTESPGRDDELHALALEIYEVQEERKQLTEKEAELRLKAGQRLDALGCDYYHEDGVEVWNEPKEAKLKVKLDRESAL